MAITKDLNEAERRGWEVAPHVEVRKGVHVLRGTHDEVVKRIEELERVEEMEAERRATVALENHPITQLVRRFRAHCRELGHQHDRYRASILIQGRAGHAAGLKALRAETDQLEKLTEVLHEIMRQPKEAKDANPEWQKLKQQFPDPSRFDSASTSRRRESKS